MFKRLIIKKKLKELQNLGSPDAIACFLNKDGICGIPNNSECCPIANYLYVKTGYYTSVYRTYIGYGGYSDISIYMKYPNIKCFIELFDHKKYPALITPNFE
jgi:hypothetical protein